MNRRNEPPSFNLVGMSVDEFYDEIERIENGDCVSIPSNNVSDNDSDLEDDTVELLEEEDGNVELSFHSDEDEWNTSDNLP